MAGDCCSIISCGPGSRLSSFNLAVVANSPMRRQSLNVPPVPPCTASSPMHRVLLLVCLCLFLAIFLFNLSDLVTKRGKGGRGLVGNARPFPVRSNHLFPFQSIRFLFLPGPACVCHAGKIQPGGRLEDAERKKNGVVASYSRESWSKWACTAGQIGIQFGKL